MSFARIDALCRKLEALEHAQAMLGVDEAVQMPAGGGEKRAEAMGTLAGMYHEMAAAPHIADWIADAAAEPLNPMQQAALREFRRSYTNLTCLPSDFVARQVAARIRSEQLWRELRPRGDWHSFLPAFEGIVGLAREEAQMRAATLGLSPYDAMVEQYDPGSRSAAIAPVFAGLKTFLSGFIPEALDAQERRLAARPRRPFAGPYPAERQKALGLALMQAVGFDFGHGRLDISHHPFCGGVPSDVRMTTRYRTDEFLSSLMGILHETGHGLYEQGLPPHWSHWPVGRARGMATHESQSLFVEMQLVRNPAFWDWAMPLVRQHLGESVADWEAADVLSHVHGVKPGLIRVDADEATYPLHVILRFEIEQELIGGGLAARDVPELWDIKMREYLGLATIDNPKDGPMQDVHWPGGAFGYFPSYTLGAMMAAQQWAAAERAIPDLDGLLRRGDFAPLTDWRRRNIWQKASSLPAANFMIEATGAPLSAAWFENHLRKRYLA